MIVARTVDVLLSTVATAPDVGCRADVRMFVGLLASVDYQGAPGMCNVVAAALGAARQIMA